MAKDALREVNAHNVDAINKVAFMPKEKPKEETFFAEGGHAETKKSSDKLEEVNKFNQKKFNRKENLFFIGGPSNISGALILANRAQNNGEFNPFGKYGNTFTSQLTGGKKLEFKTGFTDPVVKDSVGNTIKPAGAGSSQQTPQKATMSPSIGAALGGAAGIVQNIGKSEENPNGLFDVMDPVHALAGGRQSGAGNAMGSMGVEVFKAGAMSGNPYIMAAGAALKVVGGLTNAAFGIKENKEMKKRADESISTNSNFMSNADNFDAIKGPASMTNTNVYEGGWFSGGKAADKNAELAQRMADAYSWADRSVANNVRNISQDQLSDFLRNYSAFGGYLTRPKRRRKIKR